MRRKITRRDFIKVGTAGLATGVLAGCKSPRRWVILEPYVKAPEEQVTGVANWYASTCRQCPAGCGIIVRIMNGRAIKIEGNPEHPLNRGKLCPRGQAGLQVLYNPDRLHGPVQQKQRGSRQFEAIAWNDALNTLNSKLQSGAKLAIWLGSATPGHLYDLFSRFAKSRQAPAPLVYDLYGQLNSYHALAAANQQLFGDPSLPSYTISQADAIFSFGENFLGPGLSATRYGVDYGAFRSQPLGKRGYLIQLSPRMSITSAKADWWLSLRPGTEGLVAQALMELIASQGLGSSERQQSAQQFASGQLDLNQVAQDSGISTSDLMTLAKIFAGSERPVAIPGGSLAGSGDQGQALQAVQALNVVVGNLGQAGGLWPTMPVPKGFASPSIAPFSDVQTLIQKMQSGQVDVLLVHGANPVFELPPKSGFAEAIKKVGWVVSFSPMVDETAVWADQILPDNTYLESWGYEVVSPNFAYPVIGSQQPVVMPLYDTRATGDILLTLAHSFPDAAQSFPWSDEVAFLSEMVAQLPAGANGGQDAAVRLSRFRQHGGWWPEQAASPPQTTVQPQPVQLQAPSYQGDQKSYPYHLVIYLSDFLSDGRGANQPWLQGSPDPMTTIAWQTWIEVHPDTMAALGLVEGDRVRVTSPEGEIQALVYPFIGIRPDTVAIPTGQGHSDYGRYAQNRGSNPIQLVGMKTGPDGNNLAWATLRVRLEKVGAREELAKFGNTMGVYEGFINQAFPAE